MHERDCQNQIIQSCSIYILASFSLNYTYLLKEKAVKAESKRVEAVMKKLAAQQVQREKDEGQKRLEEALVKAREEFLLEKSEAVQKAREEEHATASAEAKKVAQVEEEKRKQIILAAEKEKQV